MPAFTIILVAQHFSDNPTLLLHSDGLGIPQRGLFLAREHFVLQIRLHLDRELIWIQFFVKLDCVGCKEMVCHHLGLRKASPLTLSHASGRSSLEELFRKMYSRRAN
jgi:hypothetical protein